ncbi:MAG: IS3 family transposase [Frankiaceae bacterium]
MTAQRVDYRVPCVVSCRALGVSSAWYYLWRRGDVSLRRARRKAIDAVVAEEFLRRKGRDGSPPITARLRDLGWRISKNTVADSMRRQGLAARPRRKRRGLTKADRRARKPADLLGRDFAPPALPDQRWVSDLTEVATDEGVLYLASILDLFSRRAVGYALGEHHDADLAAAAVQVAIAVRGGDVAGVVFHTDQGGEFSGGELARVCAAAGIIQSMGRTGSALDNAVAEAFHSTLEFELRSRTRFATKADARREIMEWLDEYNTVRFHSTNGMLSPVDYEHGRRRPAAKTYDQLRRRRRRHTGTRTIENNPKNEENEAEATPQHIEPLRDGHQASRAYGPASRASRAAFGGRHSDTGRPPSLARRARPVPLTREPPRTRAGETNGRPGPAAAHARRNPTMILKHKELTRSSLIDPLQVQGIATATR